MKKRIIKKLYTHRSEYATLTKRYLYDQRKGNDRCRLKFRLVIKLNESYCLREHNRIIKRMDNNKGYIIRNLPKKAYIKVLKELNGA